MRIKRVEVENFRALRNVALNFTATTAILGENNSGKSALLLALDFFFAASPRTTGKDYSDGNIQSPINITVHFFELTPSEREEFGSNLLDGELVVTRRFSLKAPEEDGKFFMSARVNPDFQPCRKTMPKNEKKKLYNELRENYGEPPELPKVSSADEIDEHLKAWEVAYPEKLRVEKVAGFKGWTNVASGKLKSRTNYILMPAVQDAAEDIQQSKSSPVKNLIDTIARQTIENSAEFKKFVQSANEQMASLTDPKKVPVLADISAGMTNILKGYYKDSALHATWEPIAQIQPSFPSANIEVTDNDFVTQLDGVGHGLQRAIILTVLQYMAEYSGNGENQEGNFEEPQSDIIIAIEEPEIYQHPTKQRLFAKILRRLTEGFSKTTGVRIQTIFVTHSPLLVSIANCEDIRLVRVRLDNDAKKNVSVSEIDLKGCATRCAQVSGRKPEDAWSATQFAAKLHTFDSELAEGFFAKCVVLVEGVGDQATLEAWYRLKGRDPHLEGIVIAKVEGKSNLDRPIVIFQALNVPCYWIFDNDRNTNKDRKPSIKMNMILQQLGGVPRAKCEEWPVCLRTTFAAWDRNLEAYVRSKVGEDAFQACAGELSEEFSIERDMCLKFPASASSMFKKLQVKGYKFSELDEILKFIDSLVDS